MSYYLIVVEQGPPRGDLYELEQTTWHRVVDARTGETVLEFRGDMDASLSRDDGMWDDYRFTGVSEVILAPDERSVLVKYFDGAEETVLLPERRSAEDEIQSAPARHPDDHRSGQTRGLPQQPGG